MATRLTPDEIQYYAAMHEICTLAPSLRLCDACRFAPVALSADDALLTDTALFSSEGVDALLVHPEGELGTQEWFNDLPEIKF